MEFLREITIDDLPPPQREVAELIGMEAYIKLVDAYGGMRQLYIPKFSEIQRDIRNKEIISKFDGYNFSELAREFELTEVSIREIVKTVVQNIRRKPMEGQDCLFEP